MPKISNKQINYIVYLLERQMPELFKRLPNNTKKYSDETEKFLETKVDYRRRALEDKISGFTSYTANKIIKSIQKGDEKEVKILLS